MDRHRAYTLEELHRLREANPGMSLDGYVSRAEEDGKVRFVPWYEATGGGGTFGGTPERPLREYGGALFDPLPPIVKRTPLQRVDSLMLKVLSDFRAHKVMTEEQIKGYVDEVTAQAWKDGRTEITGEVVRQVIQRFMERSEKEHEEADAHKVVRSSPTD